MDSNTTITKETKNKIRVDYEGKLSFKERLQAKLKASNTWIKASITVVRFILMLGVSYVILYPFFARIAQSFMTQEDIMNATVTFIPRDFTLEIYKSVIVDKHYLEALLNTLLLSLACALIQMLISCLIGYGLAKFKFKGNKLIMVTVIITMVIPHMTLKRSLIQHFTEFDILKVIGIGYKGPIELITGNVLRLSNTFWPLVILSVCGLAFKNGLYIYLMRQFFKGVPDELEESAYVDGAGTFRTFFQIILPLAVPMMITVFLFSFSWQWTDEFYSTIFFINPDPETKVYLMPDVYPLPYNSLIPEGTSATIKYETALQNTAGIMIIAPLVILYLFCQRYLVQGIERSGLVG